MTMENTDGIDHPAAGLESADGSRADPALVVVEDRHPLVAAHQCIVQALCVLALDTSRGGRDRAQDLCTIAEGHLALLLAFNTRATGEGQQGG